MWVGCGPGDGPRWSWAPTAPSAFYKIDTGYRACTLARGYNGRTRALERHGRTKAAAERELKAALRDRAGEQSSGDITADSRLSTLAEAWYAGLTDLSPVTMPRRAIRSL